MVIDTSRSTGASGREGYLNDTFLNSMVPLMGACGVMPPVERLSMAGLRSSRLKMERVARSALDLFGPHVMAAERYIVRRHDNGAV